MYFFLDFVGPYFYNSDMAHIHKKMKKGRPYYYVRETARVNGKPRVVNQVYLGSPERIMKMAAGEIFGLDSPGYPNLPAATQAQGEVDDWTTNTYSFFGEYQWNINEKWTMFAGARTDDHTYTRCLFSPRAALVFMPTDLDTIKFIANQSVRRAGDDELRGQYKSEHNFGDEETIRTGELRYKRLHSDNLLLALSGFYEEIELVAWDATQQASDQLADYDVWGIEAEVTWRSDELLITFSHAYTKLIDFHLNNPGTVQAWSAEPYGYGHDLAIWSNHISKLFASYQITEQLSLDGSLQIYWDFAGAKDQTRYNNEQGTFPQSTGLGLSDPGYDKAFRGNYYLNLGAEYLPGPHWSLRLDLYNILGWFDKDLNKRNFTERVSEYRCEAAAAGLSLRYTF